MTLGAPQIIMITLTGMSLGVHLVKHGEARPPYSAGLGLLGACLEIGLLYWGGFFGDLR